MNKTDIFVIAGESSGDAHSAKLIQDILKINNNLIIHGIGGARLQEQGVNVLFNYSEINYIGFANIARNYIYLKRLILLLLKIQTCFSTFLSQ